MGGATNYESLFRAYDIRGVYPKELDLKFAYKLGKAFVLFTQASDVAIGYDGRTSSKKLFEYLAKGIQEQGANVIDLGLVSTPECYYSLYSGKYEAGIMITASHLQKQYNGFKLMGKNGTPIFLGHGEEKIKELIYENDFPKPKKKGSKKKKSWSKDYAKYLSELLLKNKTTKELLKDLKVVVDQSNGSGIRETEMIKKAIPKVKIINSKVSGSFPGHDPNPLIPASRKALIAEIKRLKADIGIIYDGDADRVCFVDEKGQFVRPDIILSILVDDLKSGKVVYDTRSSKSIPELAKKRGVHAFMSRAGRSYIMEAMKTQQADIGGEGSGHYFFKENKYLDSAGITTIKILHKLISEKKASGKKMSEIVQEHDLHFHSGEINFKVKNPSKAFLIVEQGFREANKTIYIDGLSVYYDTFWFNIRKSNTESVIRINVEAETKEELDKITSELTKIMNLAK